MAINKIIVDGVTKIDLSQDTVTANKVLEGLTFHDATGSLCTGTMTVSTGAAGAHVAKICTSEDTYGRNVEVYVYGEDNKGMSVVSSEYKVFAITDNTVITRNIDYSTDSYVTNSGESLYVVACKPIGRVEWDFASSSSSTSSSSNS